MSVPASTAVLEFVQTSADCNFGLRCLDNSTTVITGQPRTAGKNVTWCKLTANVSGSLNLINTGNLTNSTQSTTTIDPCGFGNIGMSLSDNGTNATHGVFWSAPAVTNVTQTCSLWIAPGTGTNNRYMRVTMGNATVQTSVTNGFYVDVDMLLGTVGTVTAVGNGTATSVSIVASKRGWLIRMTGKVSSALATPSVLLNVCSSPGTLSFAGASNMCWYHDHVAIVTAASIADTMFSVDTDTGWLADDAVVVVTTSQSASETECYPLNANAGSSSFTSAIYPYHATIHATHSGVSPTQAEVGLLTRNVIVRSTSTTLMAYMYCERLASVTAQWAEFYYLGASSQYAITMDGGAAATAKSFTYCSVHDSESTGFWFPSNAVTALNITVSNCVVWNCAGSGISINGGINNADWIITYNLVVSARAGGDSGIHLGDIGGNCSYNTVVGYYNQNIQINEANILGTFTNNTCHSNNGGNAGLYITARIRGNITNLTCYRINSAGISLTQPANSDTIYTNLTLFGNSNAGMGVGDACVIRGTSIICGDTTFPQYSGIIGGGYAQFPYDVHGVDFAGGYSIFVPNTNRDIDWAGTLFIPNPGGVFVNCKFGTSPPITKSTSWAYGAFASFQKYNQTAGDHRTEMYAGQVKTDTTVYHTASPSMRMTPLYAVNVNPIISEKAWKLESAPKGKGIQVAVNSGYAMTPSVWVRKNIFYTGSQPRLIVRANAAVGITSDTVLASCTDVVGGSLPVWDSATTASVNLTGGSLVATNTGTTSTNQGAHVASALGKTTGKYYFEITLTTLITGAQVGVGIGTTTSTYAGMSGNGTLGAHMIVNGTLYGNGTSSGMSLNARSSGNVICIAADLDSRLAWFRVGAIGNWNNSGSFSPITGVGGVTLPATGAMVPFVTFGGAAGVANVVLTGNFGATAFTGGVPSGYFSGWGPFAGSVATDTWVTISGTTVPATDDGAMEFIVDCDGTAGFVNVDDWRFTSAVGPSYLLPGLIADTDTIFAVSNIGPAMSAEVSAFLARTTGLDTTHTNAYTALIDGLVADGVWAKLDMLHIYATQDSTTAQLNLVSSSYPATLNGSPTFTADRGFRGAEGSSTIYIDTGFNPSSASSPKFTLNSAHISAWAVDNAAPGYSQYAIMGLAGSSADTLIIPRSQFGGDARFRINASTETLYVRATQDGYFLANRSASNALQGYINGVSVVTSSVASSGLINGTITTLSTNGIGTGHFGGPHQCAAASIGSSLTSGEATAFYNRLRTYMTAVGVP